MRPSKRLGKRPTSAGEQIFVSLIVILLGLGFCLIPLVFGLEKNINYRGNVGPGAAASLIVGGLFLIYGLVGMFLGLAKAVRGLNK